MHFTSRPGAEPPPTPQPPTPWHPQHMFYFSTGGLGSVAMLTIRLYQHQGVTTGTALASGARPTKGHQN